MIHKILVFLIFVLSACTPEPLPIDEINRYKVEVQPQVKETVGVFPISIGSSLKFAGQQEDKLIFYGLTDRGPNVFFEENGKKFLIVTAPNFTPCILKIEVNLKTKTAEVVDALKLSFEGKNVGFISPIKNNTSPNQTLIVDTDGNPLVSDKLDIDPESLAIDKDGNFWVADEYGPSLNYVNFKTGNIEARFTPNEGLPEILKWRQVNKGFEAVAVAPNGLVYMALQDTLDINKETKDTANFIRIVEFNPITLASRMFAYPYERNIYKRMRISDMDVLNEDELILIEKGITKDSKFHDFVFKTNIKEAQDITNMKIAGKDLEYSDLANLDTLLLKKEKIIDMRDHGWKHKKMEGLAVVDSYSIAVINDNGFGLGPAESYLDENKQRKFKVPVADSLKDTDLWIVKFKNSLN